MMLHGQKMGAEDMSNDKKKSAVEAACEHVEMRAKSYAQVYDVRGGGPLERMRFELRRAIAERFRNALEADRRAADERERMVLSRIEAQAVEIANLKKERETNANELRGMAEFLRRRSRDLTLGQVTPMALAKELESLAGSIDVELEPDDV